MAAAGAHARLDRMVNPTCLLASADGHLKRRLMPTLQRLGLHVNDVAQWPDPGCTHEVDLVIIVAEPARCAWHTPGSQRPMPGPGLVLVLMPHAEVVDRVLALRWGADAVLDHEQLSADELSWHVRALLRRRAHRSNMSWQLDVSARQLRRDHWAIDLSPTEQALLLALMPRPGQTLARGEILSHGAMRERGCQLNAVELAVSRLRGKFARAGLPCPLLTDRGFGYRWQEAP